jgi:uncharacterized protein (DUF1015 family)
MVRIEPFKGIRPTKALADKVAAPPYDVLNSEEAREMAKGNPYSFLHISKPEIDLPENIDHYSDLVYQKAAENFKRFLQDKIFIQDESKCFYLYKQIWGHHVQVGLVAGASVDDYQKDIIKKHELTREDKENDRMRHIQATNANAGPVFLTFRDQPEILATFEQVMRQQPECDFTSADGVQHIFYVISDQTTISSLKKMFSRLDYLYVADGHHRSASASRVKDLKQKANTAHTGNEEYNFFLSVIFPASQMKIMAYNRVVKDLKGMCKAEFFQKLRERFEVVETDSKAPASRHQFCLYIEGKWYLLSAKPETFNAKDPIESLDVQILQKNLLDPILGIINPRTDNRIDFVGGIRGTKELEKLVDSKKYVIGISMFPTSIEELFKVADAGKIMPPKSTWFEPKLKSGLVVHLLD